MRPRMSSGQQVLFGLFGPHIAHSGRHENLDPATSSLDCSTSQAPGTKNISFDNSKAVAQKTRVRGL